MMRWVKESMDGQKLLLKGITFQTLLKKLRKYTNG